MHVDHLWLTLGMLMSTCNQEKVKSGWWNVALDLGTEKLNRLPRMRLSGFQKEHGHN